MQKRKLIVIATVGFCLLLLLDWTGLTGRGFPTNWGEALIQVCVNIGWTFLFTVASYFVLIRPLRRPKGDDHPSVRLPDRYQRHGDSRAEPKPESPK
jgi:hypothetical protein